MRVDVVRPYVEKLLKEFFSAETLIVDGDGDWPVRVGSAMYYVRLVDGDPPVLSIFSAILRDVTTSPELFEELNRINSSVRFGRLYFADGVVWAKSELVAESMDKVSLSSSCYAIGGMADQYDTELGTRFGGAKMFDDAPAPGTPPVDKPADV